MVAAKAVRVQGQQVLGDGRCRPRVDVFCAGKGWDGAGAVGALLTLKPTGLRLSWCPFLECSNA